MIRPYCRSRRLRARSAALLLLAATACAGARPGPGAPDPAPPAVQSQAPPPARPGPTATPLAPLHEVQGISEYRLANGLKLLLFPDPTLSTLTVNATYLVGSRHEGPGEGGMAHLLEHMLFKGTPSLPNIQNALQERGARWNGTTSSDRTNYYETLAASEANLDFALRLEADRMVHSSIRAEDLATEMTVVRNEFESGENDPRGVLQERMFATAFLFHSYGRPTIGNQSDIERVPVESLRAFYRKYYQPDNAMLVIAGSFEPKLALARVQEYFGAIPRPERALTQPYTEEPPQDGPRSVVLSRVGSVAAAGLLYHVPAATHPDSAALRVLAQVLSAPPAGRLYKTLVQSKQASSVGVAVRALRDPGVLSVSASIPVGRDPEQLQQRLIETVEGVAGSIRPDEVERVRTRMLKNFRLALTDSRSIALSLSEAEAVGDWRMLFLGNERIEKVTADDVNRVARTYLIASNRTAGLFRPTAEPKRAAIPRAPEVAALFEGYRGRPAVRAGEAFEASAENIERSTQRRRVAGIDVALLVKRTRGEIVEGRIRLGYGTEKSLTGFETATALMPALMLRGTTHHDYQGLRDAQDAIDTQLGVSGGLGYVDISVRTTRDHLAEALALAGEIVRTPSFPAAELEVIRQARLTGYETRRSDPEAQLQETLTRALEPYPRGTPLYRPTLDERIERTRKIARVQIAELHRRFLGAQHAQASFVGDFDAGELEHALSKAFAHWTSAEPYARILSPYLPIQPLAQTLDTPDKKMAVVARATAFRMRTDDPDFPALDLANAVLGRGASSRLFTALRQKAGLSYGASSSLDVPSESDSASLVATAITAPENARRAQALLQQEFQRWLEQPVSERELAELRSSYIERFRSGLSDDGFLADALLSDLRLDRRFGERQQRVDAAMRLTPEQIQEALRRHLAESPLVDLSAGDAAKFGPAAERDAATEQP